MNQLPPDNNFSGAAETIPIYVRDPRVGVLVYYAVLAYPKRSELPKRRTFIEAMAAMIVKGFVHQIGSRENVPRFYTGFKNEKIQGVLRRGSVRLAHRLSAGTVGWCIRLNGKYLPFDVPAPNGAVGRALQGPNTVNEAIGAYLEIREGRREDESAMANAKHRVWGESLSVLHLAMTNPITIASVEAQVNSGKTRTSQAIDRDLFDSIYEPEWLCRALTEAEELRLTLGHDLRTDPDDHLGRGFSPDKATRLIPTNNLQETRLFGKSSIF